jgi:hypothetical protein
MSFTNFIRLVSPDGETWEEYSRRKWGVGVTRYHGWLDGKVEKAWTKVLSRPDATLRWKALLKKGWRETQRRNPLVVREKGKLATQMLGGMAIESAEHLVIEAVHDGEVCGVVDLLLDEEGDARLELISVPPNKRNQRSVILPLLRKAFEVAKAQKCGQLYTEACHRKIYDLAIRFRMPDWVSPNGPLISKLFADHGSVDPSDEYFWKRGGKISVPMEDLPPAAKLKEFPCRGDAHECDGSKYYTGPKIKNGDFFTDGFKIYQWTKTKEEDGKTSSTLVMNVQYRYDYKGPNESYRPFYIAWTELQPKEMGKVLPDVSPLDDPDVRTDRLPMMKMGWFL